MSSSVSFLNFANADLSLREDKQDLIASNIANADTPGYKARDFSFSKELSAALSGSTKAPTVEYSVEAPVGLDGNDVSPSLEKLESMQNINAMNAEVTFLHQSVSDLLTALRPNPNGI